MTIGLTSFFNNEFNNTNRILSENITNTNHITSISYEVIRRRRMRQRSQKHYNFSLKKRIIYHYSKGKNCCACCGEKELDFLAIDHINGDGNKHRKEIASKTCFGGINMYKYLKEKKYPSGFQVLCHNCNMSKGFKRNNGMCIHQILKNKNFSKVF